MSHTTSPWKQGFTERRLEISNSTNNGYTTHNDLQQYHVDAPVFTPGAIGQPLHSSVQRMHFEGATQLGPPSPFYPLETSTFLPPDTPSLPRTPSPEQDTQATSTVYSAFITPQKLQKLPSDPSLMGIFHTPGSIWDSIPNETIRPVRGTSEGLLVSSCRIPYHDRLL